ncbi:hypothetical protein [Streptomyces sp. NPDC058092]|uniref:hypothetical protein n=1 Tax=Streptomyces sp. NPDC058092 TaxID=3346336 RepID=UPI0036EFAFAE
MPEPGEQAEVTALVNLSEVSSKKNIVMGIAAAVLSGGAMTVAAAPQPMYLAVTGKRLFIFQANQFFVKPDRHVATFQIKDVKRTEVERGLLKHSFILVDESLGRALRLFFPLVSRKELDEVARRIAVASAQEPAVPRSGARLERPTGPDVGGEGNEHVKFPQWLDRTPQLSASRRSRCETVICRRGG